LSFYNPNEVYIKNGVSFIEIIIDGLNFEELPEYFLYRTLWVRKDTPNKNKLASKVNSRTEFVKFTTGDGQVEKIGNHLFFA